MLSIISITCLAFLTSSNLSALLPLYTLQSMRDAGGSTQLVPKKWISQLLGECELLALELLILQLGIPLLTL